MKKILIILLFSIIISCTKQSTITPNTTPTLVTKEILNETKWTSFGSLIANIWWFHSNGQAEIYNGKTTIETWSVTNNIIALNGSDVGKLDISNDTLYLTQSHREAWLIKYK